MPCPMARRPQKKPTRKWFIRGFHLAVQKIGKSPKWLARSANEHMHENLLLELGAGEKHVITNYPKWLAPKGVCRFTGRRLHDLPCIDCFLSAPACPTNNSPKPLPQSTVHLQTESGPPKTNTLVILPVAQIVKCFDRRKRLVSFPL